MKVGINGFGRMGRLTFSASFEQEGIEFVRVNDTPGGGSEALAHLLNLDSVHGRWRHEARSEGDDIVIGSQRTAVRHAGVIAAALFVATAALILVSLPGHRKVGGEQLIIGAGR